MCNEVQRFHESAECGRFGGRVEFVLVVCDDGTTWAWCQNCYMVRRVEAGQPLCQYAEYRCES